MVDLFVLLFTFVLKKSSEGKFIFAISIRTTRIRLTSRGTRFYVSNQRRNYMESVSTSVSALLFGGLFEDFFLTGGE